MQYPSHLKPEDQFLRIIFAGVSAMAEPIEVFATWCITGVAAILGLLVANLDSVSKIISAPSLRWGIVLLTSSMLAGALAKQFGIAIRRGLAMLESLYTELESPDGSVMMESMTTSPEEMQSKMAAPFLWPINVLMLRAARRGATDPINGEKRFVKLLCIQMYGAYAQAIFAVVGLLIFASGISS